MRLRILFANLQDIHQQNDIKNYEYIINRHQLQMVSNEQLSTRERAEMVDKTIAGIENGRYFGFMADN